MTEKDPTTSFDVDSIIAEMRQNTADAVSAGASGPEPSPAQTPEEDDIKIYHPKSEKKRPAESDKRHDTRILDFVRHRKDNDSPVQMDGQLTFEALVDEEPDETDKPDGQPKAAETVTEVPADEETEARLKNVRKEKVENFKLIENEKTGFRLTGDEEQTQTTAQASEQTQDYNSYAETAAVRSELAYRRRSGWLLLFMAGGLEFVLLCLLLLTRLTVSVPMGPVTFLTLNLLLLVAIMLAAHRVIADGIGGIFHLRAVADTGTALAAFAAVVHTMLQYVNLTEVANGDVVLYNAVSGLALFLALCGRQFRIVRICRNFRFVSFKGNKFAAHCVRDARQTEQLGRFVPTIGTPEIVWLRESEFLSKFMENSYDEEGCESLFRWFSPVLLGLCAVTAVLYTFFGGEVANWWSAIGLFTGLLCVSAPAFSVAGANLPLLRAGKRLLQRGAVLIGWKAVREFDDVNALVVDAADVFPSENVLLHGIKTFAGARIDEAILDAAAVSIQAGGPLSGVFRRVIENRVNMLQEVDTLLYEQEMGLSGWVGGRRVLVGNRRLLENHGVDVPSRDYEMRYAKDNRQLVYLSTGGELCAMFVVSYTAEPGIADALGQMERAGMTLLIRTSDPNVTRSLVHEVFGIDEDAVRILDSAAGRVYDSLTAESAAREEALLASNGRLAGIGAALSQCRRLSARVRATGVLQMISAGLGFLLTAVAAATGMPLEPSLMLLHLILWTLVTWAVGGLKTER